LAPQITLARRPYPLICLIEWVNRSDRLARAMPSRQSKTQKCNAAPAGHGRWMIARHARGCFDPKRLEQGHVSLVLDSIQ
jgi:hypothetical protein